MLKDPGRYPRVLVLSSTFPRWQGDTEPRFILDLCRHLSQYADILVLTPHTDGAARNESIEGVRVHRFRYFVPAWQGVAYEGGILARLSAKPWRVLQLPFFLIAMWWTCRALVREWKPDVIHAHWIVPQALVACLVSGGRVPIVCTSHGGDLHGLQSWVFLRLKGWILKRCQVVTVVSQHMVQRVRSIAPRASIEVIPMGTDLQSLFTPPEEPAVRKDKEILFVGRLVETKGLRYLLHAFALLRKTDAGVKLTVAGDGPLRVELQGEAESMVQAGCVTFLGSVQQRKLPGLFRCATLAVFPYSGPEGFGLVVIEAMGCGCPIIASDVPAIREIVQPELTGTLVPPCDPAALADALRRCLSDASLRSRFASAAIDSVRQRFDWKLIAAHYWQSIEGCMQPPTSDVPARRRS